MPLTGKNDYIWKMSLYLYIYEYTDILKTMPCVIMKAVSRSLAIALVEIAVLVFNWITLVLSLVLFVGVNAGGGDKDQKN